jgi:hypothetical protein
MRSTKLIAAAVITAVSVSTHAQISGFQPMPDVRLREAETNIANAHAAAGTEADFAEVRLAAGGPVTWSGHAVFSKIGFVLDYTVPAGRRVVSDLSVTRVITTTAQQKAVVMEAIAARSPYAGLSIFTGATRPSFRAGQEDTVHGACFVYDGQRAYFADTSSWRIGRMNNALSPDMHFTNIRSLATPQAVAKVSAALAP